MKPRPFVAAFAAAALALSAGCTSANEATPSPPPAEQSPPEAVAAPSNDTTAQMQARCPMLVEGSTVEASDTETGVALTFTTTSGDVTDLRDRASRMAEMYTMRGGGRGMMWRHMGGAVPGKMGPGGGMGRMMPAATATIEEIDGGARILLVPSDASQLQALREHARMHLEHMRSGECPMLAPEQ